MSKAKTAYELIKTSGYPSVSEFVGLLEHGNVVGLPGITRDDVRRAYEIYGQPVAYVRGKMTKKKVARVQYSEELKSCEREQLLYADVMTIGTKKSLLSVSEPLQLTTHHGLKDESQSSLGQALQSQLQVYQERGFSVKVAHVDPASAFMALRTQFPGVLLDEGVQKIMLQR